MDSSRRYGAEAGHGVCVENLFSSCGLSWGSLLMVVMSTRTSQGTV